MTPRLAADVQPIYVRMPADLHAAVKAAARAADLTMAQYIRAALRASLDGEHEQALAPG